LGDGDAVLYHCEEEGGLPPLGPPLLSPTSCYVHSPPMTHLGRGRRKSESTSSTTNPEVAELTAAHPATVLALNKFSY